VTLSPDIALVIVNYGSDTLLDENFTRLDGEIDPAHVVVVDNFRSATDTARMSDLATRRGWSLLRLPQNRGFGAGTNAGVARAQELGCRRFLIINPDARIDAVGVAALAAECAAHPKNIVGARIRRPDGSVWFNGGSILLDRGRTSTGPAARSSDPGGWVTGACLMIHTDLWDRLGGFDDEYFLYWEDVDLSWRCTKSGGRLTVLPDLDVEHSVGGTQAGGGKSATYVYYNCRNRLLFASRHLSRRRFVSWLLSSPGYASAVMQHGGRRSLARHPLTMIGAALFGTAAGGAQALIRRAARPTTTYGWQR